MVIPLNIRQNIERVEKKANKLKADYLSSLRNANNQSDLGRDLHSLCGDLSHYSDQVANNVWDWLNMNQTATKKPNIYWPISQDEDNFRKKLRDWKMLDLEKRAPDIFDAFKSSQKWHNSEATLPDIKNLANSRHVSNLELELQCEETIRVGRGKSVYVENMYINEHGLISELSGYETEAGVTRPLTVERSLNPLANEVSTRNELFSLIKKACSELKGHCAAIYRTIDQ